jgi:hypothetical protein
MSSNEKFSIFLFEKIQRLVKKKVKRNVDQQQSDNSSNEQKTSNENEIESCFGGLNKEEAQNIQDELGKAKEQSETNFSSRSRCVIQ